MENIFTASVAILAQGFVAWVQTGIALCILEHHRVMGSGLQPRGAADINNADEQAGAW